MSRHFFNVHRHPRWAGRTLRAAQTWSNLGGFRADLSSCWIPLVMILPHRPAIDLHNMFSGLFPIPYAPCMEHIYTYIYPILYDPVLQANIPAPCIHGASWSIWVVDDILMTIAGSSWPPKPAGVLSEMHPAPRQRAGGGPLRAAAAEWQGQGSMIESWNHPNLYPNVIYIYIYIYPVLQQPRIRIDFGGFTRVYLIFSSCQWGGFPAHFQ